MDKKQLGYWTEFRSIWWREIMSWFGWGDWKQTITSTVLALGTIAFLIVGGRFDLANEELSVRVASTIFGVFWLFVILLISYISANRTLYVSQQKAQYSQQVTIKRLAKRLESRTTKTANIKITPGEEVPHAHEDGYYYAYLDVFNGEENNLVDCYIYLTTLKIKIANSEEWGDYLDWVTKNTKELTWSNFDTSKDEKRIRRKKSERINLAKWKVGKHPIFIFADGTEDYLPENNIYVEISFNSEISENGKLVPIDEVKFHGFLKLSRGTYIQEGGVETTTINGVTTEIREQSKEIPFYRFYIEPGEL